MRPWQPPFNVIVKLDKNAKPFKYSFDIRADFLKG